MSAVEAPYPAYAVLAIAKRPDGIQPLFYLTQAAFSADEAANIALASWREELPAGTEFRAVEAYGLNWRRLTEGEIARCVS